MILIEIISIKNQDIRLTGLAPFRSFNFGFEKAASSKFRITADINMNDVVDNTDFESGTHR